MIDMYSIDDLHYNSKGVVQISPTECFEDLATTLIALESELKTGSKLEQNMLSFFQQEVEHKVAYRDNDVNQGYGGPRRLHVVGKLKKIDEDNGIYIRLGIRAFGENPLIPSLQALYLLDIDHVKYMAGLPVGSESDPDRWVYDFCDRYQGRVEGVKVRTRLGIKSLTVIQLINEMLLADEFKRLDILKSN